MNDSPVHPDQAPDPSRTAEATDDGGGAAPRLVVTRGGTPDAEHLAALVVALSPAPDRPAADDRSSSLSAWSRAALIEGVGGPTALEAPDLALLERYR